MSQPAEAFSNAPLTEASLPSVTELILQPVSARYRQINLLIALTVTLAWVLGVTLVRFQPFINLPSWLIGLFPWAISVVSALGTLWFVYHFFADPLVRFAVRELDISLSKGLIFRSLVCQPVLRVQHVEIKRGPVERLAGLSTLEVYSAGGSAQTFKIPGLPADKAEQLRQFILEHRELSAR